MEHDFVLFSFVKTIDKQAASSSVWRIAIGTKFYKGTEKKKTHKTFLEKHKNKKNSKLNKKKTAVTVSNAEREMHRHETFSILKKSDTLSGLHLYSPALIFFINYGLSCHFLPMTFAGHWKKTIFLPKCSKILNLLACSII